MIISLNIAILNLITAYFTKPHLFLKASNPHEVQWSVCIQLDQNQQVSPY